jgi:hypothetical protein
VGIAIMIAGATAVRAQTRDTVIFGLPIYNGDEATDWCCTADGCLSQVYSRSSPTRRALAFPVMLQLAMQAGLDTAGFGAASSHCFLVDSYSRLKLFIEHERGR